MWHTASVGKYVTPNAGSVNLNRISWSDFTLETWNMVLKQVAGAESRRAAGQPRLSSTSQARNLVSEWPRGCCIGSTNRPGFVVFGDREIVTARNLFASYPGALSILSQNSWWICMPTGVNEDTEWFFRLAIKTTGWCLRWSWRLSMDMSNITSRTYH